MRVCFTPPPLRDLRLHNPPISTAVLADTVERCALTQSANYLRRFPVARLI